LHIKGHKENWCLNNCHPDLFPEVKDVNTVICEQINYWLNNFKYILKHMNRERYVFFLSILLREFNTMKLEGKYNILKSVPEYKSVQVKRGFESDDSESDDE